MTQAKAQTVISSLVGLGYSPSVYKIAEDNWIIRVDNAKVDSNAVSIFATNNSITAKVNQVEFS